MASWLDRGQPRYLLKPATIGSTQLAEVLNFAPSNASIMKQTLLNHPGDPEDQAGVEALRVDAVRRYLEHLDRVIGALPFDVEDTSMARQEDRQGIGLSGRRIDSA